jgi:hypothetical protein
MESFRKTALAFTIFTGLLVIWATPLMSAVGAHYPDFTVSTISDNHLIVSYNPDYSSNFATVGGADLYPLDGKQVWGRSFLVALPSGGDLSFTINYGVAGTGLLPDTLHYVPSTTPLVIRETPFEARGHRLVRLLVFPQRNEGGRLTAYKDFSIDIRFTNGATAFHSGSASRLDQVISETVVNPDQFFRFGVAGKTPVLKKLPTDLFDDGGTWLKIAVTESGVTRIDGTALQQAGINLTTLRSDSLRLYYADGEIPSYDPTAAGPQLHQIAIQVRDGGDGLFNTGDFILFYAEAPSRYRYQNGTVAYYKNPYNDRNYYWLAVGGHASEPVMRWNTFDGTLQGTPDVLLSATRQPLRIEQDNLIKIDIDGRVRDYFTWYWSTDRTVSASVNISHPVSGDSIDFQMNAICDYTSSTITLNGSLLNRASVAGTYHYWSKTALAADGLNSIRIDLYPGLEGPFLDYLNLNYSRKLAYDGHQLEFTSFGQSGLLEYLITGMNATVQVADISDLTTPALITGGSLVVDTLRFERQSAPSGTSRYIAFTTTNALVPAAVEKVDPGSLRTDLAQYDCLVISPRSFQTALQEYVDYRQLNGGQRLRLVALEDIYNRFGFGLESPLAIRNYLKFAFENYNPPAPYAVLLAGDGHYDFLDHLGLHTPSYLPPFIWGRENSVGDDNYVYFGQLDWLDSDSSYIKLPDRGFDMMTARWPVKSPSDVSAYIEKIKGYESSASQGIWRGRVTYVADDEFKNGYNGEIIHTAQTETLAVFHTPVAFIKQKIYATDYAFASSGEKPAVNDAIINAINDGTLIINYIGHGSPEVWADEHILKKTTDLARMQNSDKLAIVSAASCSIGFFDDPGKEGMAEIMFRQRGAAIQVVSATRLVYSSDNALFNYDLFDAIFNTRDNVCEAVFATKMMHQYVRQNDFSLLRNDRSYIIFGDPLAGSGLPQYRVRFDAATDSLMMPLADYHFSGQILDAQGDTVHLTGTADIAAFDAQIVRHHPLGLDYTLGGPQIFRGTVPITNGHFSGGFVVPLDVDYGGRTAQLSAYGALTTASAVGGVDSLTIASQPSASSDNQGPQISFAFAEAPSFTSGGRIPENATLILTLSDSSGINLTNGLGHRIELTIDNNSNSVINLTDAFAYKPGSFKSGEVRLALPDLDSTLHDFRIRAWDNANNPSEISFSAMASRGGKIVIHDLMNYPNPMSSATEFFFDLSAPAEWAEMQIFTLSGKLIKRIPSYNLAVGRNRGIRWDGRDLDGDRVAEGVYIYRLTARGIVTPNGGSSDTNAEAFGKLVLLN